MRGSSHARKRPHTRGTWRPSSPGVGLCSPGFGAIGDWAGSAESTHRELTRSMDIKFNCELTRAAPRLRLGMGPALAKAGIRVTRYSPRPRSQPRRGFSCHANSASPDSIARIGRAGACLFPEVLLDHKGLGRKMPPTNSSRIAIPKRILRCLGNSSRSGSALQVSWSKYAYHPSR